MFRWYYRTDYSRAGNIAVSSGHGANERILCNYNKWRWSTVPVLHRNHGNWYISNTKEEIT